MDPATMMLIGGGASLLGGVLGNIFSGADQDKAQAAMEEAIKIIDQVGAPPELAKDIIYKSLTSVGLYHPQLEQIVESKLVPVVQKVLQETNLQNKFKQQAYSNAIDKLSQTGLGLEDVAALNKIKRGVSQDVNAASADVLRQANQRGQSTGGAALLSQFINAQQGANRESDQALDVAGEAAKARRDAISKGFQMAGSMRDTDLDLQKYNQSNLLDTLKNEDVYSRGLNQRNNALTNQSNLFNFQNTQDIANKNVDISNKQVIDRINQRNKEYDQNLDLARARSNARTGQQNFYTNKANNTAANWASGGSAVGGGLAQYGQSVQNQTNIDKAYDQKQDYIDYIKQRDQDNDDPWGNGRRTYSSVFDR